MDIFIMVIDKVYFLKWTQNCNLLYVYISSLIKKLFVSLHRKN